MLLSNENQIHCEHIVFLYKNAYYQIELIENILKTQESPTLDPLGESL
jgi:hypothetical protein